MTGAASVGDHERLRLFLAFRLPADALRALVAWQRELASPAKARIVPEENLHVTIAFLGSRPAGELEPISRALEEAADGAPEPVLRAVRYRETRSVGMVVFDDEEGRATRVAEDLHGRLERLGVYTPERRTWLPHVTVVRFRDHAKHPRITPRAPLPEGSFKLSEAAVYHSVLRPSGAQYEVLKSVPLGGG